MARLAPLERLIDCLTHLPGIGPRSAERIAFHLLKSSPEDAAQLAEAMLDLKRTIRQCRQCLGLSEGELCHLCSDPRRDQGMMCVVEEPKDVFVIEKTGSFNGVYHVLWGAIAPLEGIAADQLKVPELMQRLDAAPVREVILAMDHDQEGEATALHLAELLKNRGIKVSRLAAGIPVGSHVEYTDQATLARALEGRREL